MIVTYTIERETREIKGSRCRFFCFYFSDRRWRSFVDSSCYSEWFSGSWSLHAPSIHHYLFVFLFSPIHKHITHPNPSAHSKLVCWFKYLFFLFVNEVSIFYKSFSYTLFAFQIDNMIRYSLWYFAFLCFIDTPLSLSF